MTQKSDNSSKGGYGFGTFGGVFTPSILTIFGLIMFMRANYVIGNAGILQALGILTLCCAITFLTGLSISAISTNTPVEGGGAYFLISRVLGPGFGTAIGIALFLAQALSVPFYVLGFAEAFADTVSVPISFRTLCLITLVLLFIVTWIGANLAIKCQYLILAVLTASIIVMLIGVGLRFDPAIFKENLTPHYADGQTPWTMFAIYFPAVTGIMAGVNMSGDLKNPARAIPLGTLAAVIVSYVVYGIQIALSGGAASAATLQERPFLLLVDYAWLGTGFLIVAGVFSATLSSAIGSYLGAPRVLQAVARDQTVPILNPFSKGVGPGSEPRRALVATLCIAVIVIVIAGGDPEGGGLNLVASIVTMVFLYTYGLTNVAAFVESFGNNPSFRPRFRYYHWSTALLGAVACIWSAFQINVGSAAIALIILGGLFLLARERQMEGFSDARRGFVYQSLRRHLHSLAKMPVHAKNWRPTIILFSHNPKTRVPMTKVADWLNSGCGITTIAQVTTGDVCSPRQLADRQRQEDELAEFIVENNVAAFPEVVVLSDFDRDLAVFLQGHSIGPLKPNITLVGWPSSPDRLSPYFEHLRTIQRLGKSIVIAANPQALDPNAPKTRIDCWWRGKQNGSLMVILAHLIHQHPDWRDADLRLLRCVRDQEEGAVAKQELQDILEAGRFRADYETPISDKPFNAVLHEHSGDASVVLLGFIPPAAEVEQQVHQFTNTLLKNMPLTLLVYSTGDADLLA